MQLDVVKTKIQTDPENYPGVITAFKKVSAERGITGFFDGWAPTFAGFFFWGSASYSSTELLRRYFNDYLGSNAAGLEVPVILTSSAIGAALSTFIICPFESIRIRSVTQPDYGKNLFDVATRIIKVSIYCVLRGFCMIEDGVVSLTEFISLVLAQEEGALSLFGAVPPMLFKEVPFNTVKFLVFSLMTKVLYDSFPAGKDVKFLYIVLEGIR